MSVINSDTQTPETIVVYLHGGSAKGNDNEAQLQTQAVDDIYDFLKDNSYHARMLVPQAPEGQQWEDELLPALKALSDKYKTDESSDCFILGGSMGGYGVWNMLTEYPEYFTGAMPVACNTPRTPAENYSDTRIYSVVGGKDSNRNINSIQSFFDRLEECTEKGAKLDIESDWNHRETCEWSFTPQRLEWLFHAGKDEILPQYADTCNFEFVYDLKGTRYHHSEIDNLPQGIYIFNGEKRLIISLCRRR